ncbi:hypothetical protein JFL47_11405 [Haemophilus haemoglobinophilus]|nr:hypothetical protein [Canicola haemoglobinophilus]MBN6711820.1 hypothetical protein [Canicola haemoglobinophilus]
MMNSVDYGSLITGIDFSYSSVAVIAIAVALVGILVVIKGARLSLNMLRFSHVAKRKNSLFSCLMNIFK